MRKIVNDVYRLSGAWDQSDLGAGVYLVSTGGDLALIDTGFRNKATVIMRRIYRLGLSPSRIGYIIVTHHHPDHIGSLAAIKKITKARIIAHKADVPYIEGSLLQTGPYRSAIYKFIASGLRGMLNTEPVGVDMQVDDAQELPIAGGISIIHTPGHTPGSMCVYLKQKNLVFCGDLVSHGLGIKLPSLAFTADIPQLKQSVRKLAEHDFDILCFGHGLPIRHNAGKQLKDFAARLKL
jgi:glyoxylase-like metal-dependent hydrolase (beta-lactamase superfamily II)